MKDFTIDRSSGVNNTGGSGVAEGILSATSLMQKVATVAFNVFSKGAKLGLVGLSLLQVTQIAAQTTIVDDFRINTVTAGYQGLPSITGLNNGGFAVAWEGADISCQIYDAIGNEEGNEVHLNANTITTSYQGQVDLAELIGGGFAGVWNGAYDILGADFDNSAVHVTPDSIINTATPYEQGAPKVVSFNDSSLFMVWHGGQAGKSDISGRWYNSSKVAQGDEVRINDVTSGDQMYPTAAVLKDNTLVVAWYGAQTGNNDIYGKMYNTSVDGGSELVFNTVRTGNQQYPKIAPLKGGGFVVVWMSDQNGDYDIYFRAYNAAKTPMTSGEIRANSETAGDQTNPDVDGLDNGGFVIVWASRNPTTGDLDIVAKRFNAFGNPQQSSIFVNTQTTGAQMNPKVTGLKYGGFVVVWEGAQTGDSNIYGKKFDSYGYPVVSYPAPPTYPSTSGLTSTIQSIMSSALNSITQTVMSSAQVLSPSPSLASNSMEPSSSPAPSSPTSDEYSIGSKGHPFFFLRV